jgi:hypothetical protein
MTEASLSSPLDAQRPGGAGNLAANMHSRTVLLAAAIAICQPALAQRGRITAPISGDRTEGHLSANSVTRPGFDYSLAFGGSGQDIATAVTLDRDANVYVVGCTWSPDFPVIRAFQETYGGSPGRGPYDAFIRKQSPDGRTVYYLSYLGGNGNDVATGIAVDRDGNAYVVGFTTSSDFPVTAGALQKQLKGTQNAFLTKINNRGELVYSTLLGGAGTDAAYAVAVDGDGNAYLTGYTSSSEFPVRGALQPGINQGCASPPIGPNVLGPLGSPYKSGDAFVSKINAEGTALVYSTYLGGTCADQGQGIAVDSSGSAYVAGVTKSLDFPATSGAVQPVFTSANNSGFLVKISPSGGSLVYATYLGGVGDDLATAVAVDADGNAFVTGSSFGLSRNLLDIGTCNQIYTAWGSPFPILSGAGAFVVKVNPS